MLLLSTLVEDSLDKGYERAAARRTAGEPPRRGVLPLALGMLAVGLLLATAAEQARDRSSASAQARAALVTEIEDRQAANDRLERRLRRVRAAAAAERDRALRLTGQGAELARQLSRLEAVTGVGEVIGPGAVVRLEEPADETGGDTGPRTEETDQGRVTDRDLQTVVNEVWAAGAEAVAVNGQRLTALSAIRAAGEAILVDFRPLVPPYEIRAVGPEDLAARFAGGFGGSYLQVLRDYGISYVIDEQDQLRLPASAGVTLRHATVPDTVGSTTTGGPPAGGSDQLSERGEDRR